jgi:hypothetical protein
MQTKPTLSQPAFSQHANALPPSSSNPYPSHTLAGMQTTAQQPTNQRTVVFSGKVAAVRQSLMKPARTLTNLHTIAFVSVNRRMRARLQAPRRFRPRDHHHILLRGQVLPLIPSITQTSRRPPFRAFCFPHSAPQHLTLLCLPCYVSSVPRSLHPCIPALPQCFLAQLLAQ